MTPEAFQQQFDVPRGTITALRRYEAMLKDWQQRMNLVGPATLDHVWERHFADSAQLAALAPSGQKWLDIGAGGGFPGLVLATMGWGQFILVDSVQKKARFLEAVTESLGLDARIICARVESLPTLGVDIATARATASLKQLFGWSIRHVRPGGTYIFPKGRRWADEVSEAQEEYQFDYESHPSMTDAEARIIVARNLKRL